MDVYRAEDVKFYFAQSGLAEPNDGKPNRAEPSRTGAFAFTVGVEVEVNHYLIFTPQRNHAKSNDCDNQKIMHEVANLKLPKAISQLHMKTQ